MVEVGPGKGDSSRGTKYDISVCMALGERVPGPITHYTQSTVCHPGYHTIHRDVCGKPVLGVKLKGKLDVSLGWE